VPEASRFGLNFAVPKINAISDINIMPAQGLAAIVFRGSLVLYPSVTRGKFDSRSIGSKPDSGVAYSRRVAALKSGVEGAGGDDRRDGTGKQEGLVERGGAHVVTVAKRGQTTETGATTRFNSKQLDEPAKAAQPLAKPEAAQAPSGRDRVRSLLEDLRRAATFPARRFVKPAANEQIEQRRQMNVPESVWGANFFEFAPDLQDSAGRTTHLLTLQREFLFNSTSRLRNSTSYGLFRLIPYADVHNWLLFIPSDRGPDYFYQRFGASFYQPEEDPYRPGNFMSAVGRFALMQVIHPTERLRLRVSLSRSILVRERVALPRKAVAHGESDGVLPFVGAGSAAVYSDSISPLWKNGYAYLAVDLGEPALPFPNVKKGLMRLYNGAFPFDSRRLVGFGRDISAISEEEYKNLVRPRRIASFPAALLSDLGLEYSGIYEDGWVSQKSFVKLGASGKGESVIVEGMVPMLARLANGKLTLSVQVNDAPAETQELKVGDFRLSVRLRESSEVTTVRVQFSDFAPLPGIDGRPVSARLRSISIQ
jgi:hypothetical protein